MSGKTIALVLCWYGLLALGGMTLGLKCVAMMIFASVLTALITNDALKDEEEDDDDEQ